MDSILSLFSSYTSSELTYKKLGQLIRQIDLNTIDFPKVLKPMRNRRLVNIIERFTP